MAWSGNRPCPSTGHACISPQATVWQMRKLLTHHLAVVHRVYTAIPTTISREARLGKSCACRISNCKCGLEWKQTMSVGGTCLYKSPGSSLADEEIAHTPSSGGAQSVHCHSTTEARHVTLPARSRGHTCYGGFHH